ncbi:MAG TPA: exonuclease domain-containing protein [Herpetosiphonaceae bacterium]
MLTLPVDSLLDQAEIIADRERDPARAAMDLARQILDLKDVVVIATTTSGPRGELIEFAALASDGSILFHTLIRPQSSISARATALHGLTDADVEDAPHLAQVWTSITTVLTDRPVAGYQIVVSQRDLRRCADQLAVPYRDSHWLSIADLYARYAQRTQWCSLTTACANLGIDTLPRGALKQSRACLALLRGMAERV